MRLRPGLQVRKQAVVCAYCSAAFAFGALQLTNYAKTYLHKHSGVHNKHYH